VICRVREPERKGFTLHAGFSQGWLGISDQDDGRAFGLAGGLGWFVHPRLAVALEVSESVHPGNEGALVSSLVGPSVQWYWLRSFWLRTAVGGYWLEEGDIDADNPNNIAEGWGANLVLGGDVGLGSAVLQSFVAVEGAIATSGADHDTLGVQIGFGVAYY